MRGYEEQVEVPGHPGASQPPIARRTGETVLGQPASSPPAAVRATYAQQSPAKTAWRGTTFSVPRITSYVSACFFQATKLWGNLLYSKSPADRALNK